MSEFDTGNFTQHKIAYIIIIIIVIVLILLAKRCLGLELKGDGISRSRNDGNGDSHYLGRGHKSDSVETLLDRIEWSSYLENRISIVSRFFIITVIIMLLVICTVMQRVPTPGKTILLFLVIFIPMYATHQLHYVHGDVYNDYYIANNVKLLRKKLGLGKSKTEGKSRELSEPKCEAPSRTTVMHL